jgi:hypothetical protein
VDEVEGPTREQLKAHFVQSAVPMVGFGFMDNTVMIYAGSAIDATLGVHFGLSTMCAAACGQICSDIAGVSFGGVIEATANKLGLPSPQFTTEQRESPIAKRTGLLGSVIGVFTGCSLGLTNLLFVDTEQAREAVLAAQDDPHSIGYTVSVSNTEQEGVTTIFIDGPARKGLVAAVTAKLSSADLGIEGVVANFAQEGEFKKRKFYVTKDKAQVPDDDLEPLAKRVLRAVQNPDRYHKLSTELEQTKQDNTKMRQEIRDLEGKLEDLLITVKKKH